jgi:hypothetical protein
VNLIQQAAYDMGDLSFNLTPYRAVFIDPYKKTLSESLYSDIVAVLDKRCSNEEGCYYKTHAFPHVNLIGPVALGSYGCTIVTDILPACTSAIQVIELLETLLENLKRDQNDTSVGRVANKCIVCTLVNAASQRIKNSGGVENNDGTPSDLFLINTKSATNMGFRSIPNIDYSQDVLNLHDTKSWQLDDVIAINQEYAIEYIDGTWMVIRLSGFNKEDIGLHESVRKLFDAPYGAITKDIGTESTTVDGLTRIKHASSDNSPEEEVVVTLKDHLVKVVVDDDDDGDDDDDYADFIARL